MDKQLTTWCIKPFDKALKNQFVGLCKQKGKTAHATLHEIVARWVGEQQYQMRK